MCHNDTFLQVNSNNCLNFDNFVNLFYRESEEISKPKFDGDSRLMNFLSSSDELPITPPDPKPSSDPNLCVSEMTFGN